MKLAKTGFNLSKNIQLLILFVVVLAFIAVNGMIVYELLEIRDSQNQVDQFSKELTVISKQYTTASQEAATTGQQIQVEELPISKVVVSNNPFQSVLKKKYNKTIKPKKEKEKSKKTIDSRMNNVEILGVINKGTNQSAIINFIDVNTVRILRVNESYQGVQLKKISDDKLVLLYRGRYFFYNLGGEDN